MLPVEGYQKAIREAARIRERLGKRTVPVQVEMLPALLGIKVISDRCEGTISGYLYIAQDGEAIIGVNSKHQRTRQRYTIAHELGHYLLHKPEPNTNFVDKSFTVIHRDSKSSEGVDRKEIEANFFAAELLMPADILWSDVAREAGTNPDNESLCSTLAKKYEVSKEAMKFRLYSLGFIRF